MPPCLAAPGSGTAAAAAQRKRRPTCRNFGQLPQFTGMWVDHPDPEYRGIYDQASQCPGWGYDFNCLEATSPEEQKPDLIAREYRKVFRPHECELPEWDAAGFDKCALLLRRARLPRSDPSALHTSSQSLIHYSAPPALPVASWASRATFLTVAEGRLIRLGIVTAYSIACWGYVECVVAERVGVQERAVKRCCRPARRCMKGRRIIMIGDSLTWQMYNSLACLLFPVTVSGVATTWDKANTSVTGEYKGREWPEGRNILKQYWADVRLKGGAQIAVRHFSSGCVGHI